MSENKSKAKILMVKEPIKKRVSSFVNGGGDKKSTPKKVKPSKDAYKRC